MTAPHTSSGEKVCIGAITGVRGLKGEVRIKSFTAVPDDVAAYGPLTDEAGARSFKLRITAHAKGQLIARLDGVNDRTAAEALKGTELFISRAALPETGEDDYYFSDLVGLKAETQSGESLGLIKAMHNFGAGDIIELEDGMMVPFTKAVVPVVDLDADRIVIIPPLMTGDKNQEGSES